MAGHHGRHRQRAFSLAPADNPRPPLFSFKSSNSHLNQAFWLVCDDATSWDGGSACSFCRRPKMRGSDMEALAESEFAAIPEASLPACAKISKPFVSYLAGLMVVSPYRCGTVNPRAAGFA